MVQGRVDVEVVPKHSRDELKWHVMVYNRL